MFQQFAFTFPDDLDIKNVSDLQVHKGFILTLPFRLRTGILFSVHVGNSFDVIFRNRLDIPCGTSPKEILSLLWEGKKFRPREQFFTEALVIDKNVALSKDFREQFIASIESAGDQKMPDSKVRYFEAITALNDAIVGYHHATNNLFGGTVVERLTTPTGPGVVIAAGMMPIRHCSGVTAPGQFGPSSVIPDPEMAFFARAMSAAGIPSVMHTARRRPPAAASRTASAAPAGGTKITEASAPVAATALFGERRGALR